jgi:hypothetical protein
VLFATLAVSAEHVLASPIARDDVAQEDGLNEAMAGLLPDATLTNMIDLRQGGGPLKIALEVNPTFLALQRGNLPHW